MPIYLCIRIQFLDAISHGRGDDSLPQWPPSPLRLHQALVSAAAARWNERSRLQYAVEAIRWLEQLEPPIVVGADGVPSKVGHRLYVPDNVGDLVAASWRRGNEGSLADYRTEKDVRAIHLNGDTIHYVYSFGDSVPSQMIVETIRQAAQSITHLGWGVDMVVGNAVLMNQGEVDQLDGERWIPSDSVGTDNLRLPVRGTLDELIERHELFLNRLSGTGGFHPVPPLTRFRLAGYRRASQPLPLVWTAFALRRPDDREFVIYDTATRTRTVAGMIRHAAARLAKQQGWSDVRINSFIHGKADDGSRPMQGNLSQDRFFYVPIPTIIPRLNRVESIRRFLVAAPAHCRSEIDWIRRAIAGEELQPEADAPNPLVVPLSRNDFVVHQFTGMSKVWTTVTPMILSGHDSGKLQKAGKLIRTSFEQAGFTRALIDQCDIEYRRVGYLPGAVLASRYLPPENLDRRPRYHLRIGFPHKVNGPIVVGAGRFRGFGLLTHLNGA